MNQAPVTKRLPTKPLPLEDLPPQLREYIEHWRKFDESVQVHLYAELNPSSPMHAMDVCELCGSPARWAIWGKQNAQVGKWDQASKTYVYSRTELTKMAACFCGCGVEACLFKHSTMKGVAHDQSA